ncbi:MAG: hypothetical protein JW751_31470 [Polyangiaceae bacterium]|nr:hypothetical protein [Polyangiaceae bacterium]
MTWAMRYCPIADGRGRRYSVLHGGEELSYGDAIEALGAEPSFGAALSAELAGLPFGGFKWETPAVTRATLDRSFEFVVLDAPWLGGWADARTFAAHFVDGELVVEFKSLGCDAILIAPCPTGPSTTYAHLAAFVREAPGSQQEALWRRVGAAMERRVGTRPVWLSTAGGGVAWLHVRLDDRPKYYGHQPYRAWP